MQAEVTLRLRGRPREREDRRGLSPVRTIDLPARGRYFQARRDQNGDPVVEGGFPVEGVDLSQDPKSGRIKVAIRFRPYAGIPKGRDGLPILPARVRQAIERIAEREGRTLDAIVSTAATRELLRDDDGRIVEVDAERSDVLGKTIGKAERFLADRRAEIRRGDWYEGRVLAEIRTIEAEEREAEARRTETFADYVTNRFLVEYRGREGAFPRGANFRAEVGRVAERLGSYRLHELTRAHGEAWLAEMEKSLPPGPGQRSTIRKRIVLARTILKWAVDRGDLDRDPFAAVKLPPEPPPKEARFRPEQWRRLLAAATPSERDFLVVLKATVGRFQESCGLRVEDVDFEKRTVRVDRRKTGKVSIVPFAAFDPADDVETILRRLVDGARERGGGFLFVDADGVPFAEPVRRKIVGQRLNRLIDDAGLNRRTWSSVGMTDAEVRGKIRSERLSLHAIRATAISELLERTNGNETAIADVAGISRAVLARYVRGFNVAAAFASKTGEGRG
jgi:integrase